ncbi:MAG: TPM domain-containing protein [Acidimicrobiia bacterium]|nr:TPM domain-containing protein [Acidimicrobiia bacterium]
MKAAAVALLIVAATSFPKFTAPVVDAAGVVPDNVEQQVDAALNDYQQRSGNQIAVAIIKTTGSKALEDYSIDLARNWGVGQKGKDNGVLLLIATQDRKARIEVGRGLEGTLTDLQAGEIIDQQVVPHMRDGDPGGAIVAGTDAIRATLGDTTVSQPAPAPPPTPKPAPFNPAAFIFPVLLLLFIFSAIGRGRRRGHFWGLPIFWGGGWGGGFGGGGAFGGGGFGGGGFGGGGGGGFGGGGASGGW